MPHDAVVNPDCASFTAELRQTMGKLIVVCGRLTARAGAMHRAPSRAATNDTCGKR